MNYGQPLGQPPQKKGMSTLTIVLLTIAGMCVFSFGGCFLCVAVGAGRAAQQAEARAAAVRGNDPTSTTNTTTTTAATPPTPVELKTLLADYKSNEVRADGLYKGKNIRVSGKVGMIKKDIMDHMFVTVGTGRDFEIPDVHCTLNEANAAKAANLTKGQPITVQGSVKGLMMSVLLDDCDIVN
jgi:hypothetical protein